MTNPKFYLEAPLQDLKVLRKAEVLAVVGLSESRVRDLEVAGRFPSRVALGENSVGWLEGEIRQWLATRAKRRAVEPQGARAAHVARAATTPTKAPPKAATEPAKPARKAASKGAKQ